MYIESPEYRIPTSTGTLVLTGLNARSNVDEDEITGLDWKDAWIELPDGKLRPIQDKSSIQDKVKDDILNCLLARTYQRPMESRFEDVDMVDDYDPWYERPRSKDAWIELPDGKLRPIQDKSSIQDDENPTGIANPADYMQKITFEDSDENGKPEKVTVEKGDTEVSDKREKVIDKRVKSMKDGWGKTKVMKDKEKEAREKDVCE